MEVSVDLKWGLWSRDFSTWDDQAPGVLIDLFDALIRGETVTIRTAPRKEIRFGSVDIVPDGTRLRAHGSFSAGWDDPRELADGYFIPEELYDAFVASIPFTSSGPGVEIEFDVSADDLEQLFAQIDREEDRLLAKEERASQELDEAAADLLQWAAEQAEEQAAAPPKPAPKKTAKKTAKKAPSRKRR